MQRLFKMKILAVETTGKYGSAALIDDEGRVYAADSHDGNEHLREIIGSVESALEKAACSKDEITHVAASVGPGSFTGIRIGVTAARTFAQMKNIPCIAVSSLEGMAVRTCADAVEKGCSVIAPIINARRHQTYAGAWRIKEAALEPLLEERQYMIEELIEMLPEGEKIYFTGDGIDAYEEIISGGMADGTYVFAPEDIRYQHASSVAEIALKKAKAEEVLGYNELLPEYMRLAEAEQKLKEGSLSDKICKISR